MPDQSSEEQPKPESASKVESIFQEVTPIKPVFPPTPDQIIEDSQTKTSKPPFKPTTLAERQEETRGALATSLIGILRWVVGFLLLLIVVDRIAASTFAFHGKKYEYDSTGSKDIATLVLTSLSGLVGTALGFYFGSRGSGIHLNKDD